VTGRQPPDNSVASRKPSGELRSFGRRRGRRPSTRQEALLRDVLPGAALDLSATAPLELSQLYAQAVTDVWLEIGFGGGEHLLWQAAHNPDVGLIGCEPFQGGVLKVLDAVAAGRGRNIRLVADDARPLLRWLPPGSVGRAFILFPDPWPKLRHLKRRLVNAHLLEMLARVMRAGAKLRVASDIGDYAGTVLQAAREQGAFCWMARTPRDWRQRGGDWPPTRYEAKAIAAGRRCYYLEFQRR
jgi:tRNA (guanine-N7-)-methyltransferase